jgi:hypothetical protein
MITVLYPQSLTKSTISFQKKSKLNIFKKSAKINICIIFLFT